MRRAGGELTDSECRNCRAADRAQDHDQPWRRLPHKQQQEGADREREIARAGDACRPYRIVEGCEQKADDSDTLARASTWLMVGGAACAAAGIVLLVVRPGGPATQQAALRRAANFARWGHRF